MIPNYVAKKNVLMALNIWLILFSWLIIPLIIQICKIVIIKHEIIEFYDDKIIKKWGVFKRETQSTIFMGVYSVSMKQSLMGRIFNYGNIEVDCPGQWDVNTNGIKNPSELKEYLEHRITAKLTHIIAD